MGFRCYYGNLDCRKVNSLLILKILNQSVILNMRVITPFLTMCILQYICSYYVNNMQKVIYQSCVIHLMWNMVGTSLTSHCQKHQCESSLTASTSPNTQENLLQATVHACSIRKQSCMHAGNSIRLPFLHVY